MEDLGRSEAHSLPVDLY
jgi:hypothetical protein